MGEDHIGILLSLYLHLIQIAERDAEDDIAALTHQGVHGGAHLGIVLGNLVYNEQLLVHIHAQGLHSLGDAGVVGVGVASGVALLVDVDGAHLKVGRAHIAGGAGALGTGAGSGTGAAGVPAAAGGEAQGHGRGHDQCENLFLHAKFLLLNRSFHPYFY